MKNNLSVREVAQKLGYTLKYVYDLLYAGKLVGAQKHGKVWQIPITALRAKRHRAE